MEVADRRFSGYDGVIEVSGEIIEPQEIESRVALDPKTGQVKIVQVRETLETLVFKSSFKALMDQHTRVKELLPLEAITAFEFLVAYISFLKLKPKLARRTRDEFEQYSSKKNEAKIWYEKFEYLDSNGNWMGIVLPFLEEVLTSVANITDETRKECAEYIKWVYRRAKSFQEPPDVRKTGTQFVSRLLGLKEAIIPVGDRDWTEYRDSAMLCVIHDCNRIVFASFGPYNGEKALQAASALKLMSDTGLADYSISRIVITNLEEKIISTYIIVKTAGGKAELKRTDDTRKRFVETNECIVIQDRKSTSIAMKQLDSKGEIVIMNADDLRTFLSTSFDLIHKTGAKIVEHAVWEDENKKLRVLFHLKT